MLLLASLLGIAAVGASAFVGLGGGDDEAGGEALANDAPAADMDALQSGDSPDLLMAALDAVADEAGAEPDAGDHEVSARTDAGAADLDVSKGWGVIVGTEEPETIIGTDMPERIAGNGGADEIDGGGGADELRGGNGDDAVRGGEGNDTLHGEDGADTLDGGEGDDSLVGSSGNDTLHGDAGDDALHGDLDDDWLEGGPGSDTLFGGHGNDMLIGVVDNPATDTIDDIDTGRDFLNGGGGDDVIMAGRGDIVTAGGGADNVILGDWLDADHQAEILDFSAEEDMLLVFHNAPEGQEPEIALEPDANDPDAQRLLLDGIEIARIANAGGLTLDHVALVSQAQMPVPPAA